MFNKTEELYMESTNSGFKNSSSWWETAETNGHLYCFVVTKEHCTKWQCLLPPFTRYLPSLDTTFYAHMICGHPARGRRSQPMAAQEDLFRDLFRWFWNAIGHLHQSDQRDRSRETSRKDWAWDLKCFVVDHFHFLLLNSLCSLR